MSSNSPSLSTQSIAVFVGQVSGFAVNFLTPVLLVRLISKADYGILQQFVLLGNTMLPILGLGLASSLYYFFPISLGSQRSSYVFNTWLQMAISGGVFLFVFGFFGRQILEVLGMELLSDAGNLVAVYILFLLSGTLIDFLFILEKRVKMSMSFNPIDKLFRLFLLVGAALFYGTVFPCMIALVVYALLRFGFITYYVLSNYYHPGVWKTMSTNIRSQLAYSLPFAAGIIFTTLSQRVDKLMVNRYISEEEFASYSLAFFSIPLVTQAFTSINNVVVPNISSLFEKGEKTEVAKLYYKVVKKTSSLAIPAVLFFAVMAPELIAFLFTSEYSDATPYYRIYLATLLFTMLSYGIVLRASGNTKIIMASNFLGMIITVALGFTLIPKLGLDGAILTAVTGIAVPALLQVFWTMRILQVDLSRMIPFKSMLQVLGISLLGFLLFLPAKLYLSNPLISLIFTAPIYVLVVWYLEVRFNVFPFIDQQKKILKRLGFQR